MTVQVSMREHKSLVCEDKTYRHNLDMGDTKETE